MTFTVMQNCRLDTAMNLRDARNLIMGTYSRIVFNERSDLVDKLHGAVDSIDDVLRDLIQNVPPKAVPRRTDGGVPF